MDLDLGMRTQILVDHRGAMSVEPVADDDERAGNVGLEVTAGDPHVIAADGMGKVALVNLAGQRQPHDRG